MPRDVEIRIRLTQDEFDRWQAAAGTVHTVEEWARRMCNYALRIEVEGSRASFGRRRLLEEVAWRQCAWCGGWLESRTIRRIYCSDTCRVQAWRSRQRRTT
jgi:hypothetical protein